MSPALPVVASLYAILLAALAVALTVRVIVFRGRTGVQAGAGLTLLVIAAAALLLAVRVLPMLGR